MTLEFDLTPEELEVFIQDADDQLAVMNESLVLLEANQGDPETLQAIFRAAHTLKGAAGLIQHERMAHLTHALETVLDRLRKGHLSVTAELVDVMLASVDMLMALKEEVVTLQESGVDVDAAVEWLQTFDLDENAHHDPQHSPVPAAPSALHPDSGAFEVVVTIEESSFAPGARLYQVLSALNALGQVLHSEPAPEEVEEGSEKREIRAVVATDRPVEDLYDALGAISEVAAVKIEEAPSAQMPQKADGQRNLSAPVASGPGLLSLDDRVRIGVQQLDELMNLTGELVVGRTHLMQIEADLERRYEDPSVGSLGQVSLQLSRIIDQLAEEVMRARMVPVASLFAKFPRLVRDLSRTLGKEVELVIQGQDTELDRKVIEAMGDPLIHLLRNAVDHGLESPEERERSGKPRQGRIVLAARQHEGHILVTVSDDGRGIDPRVLRHAAMERGYLTEEAAASLSDEEAIELIFRSGMSTAKQVTDLSGRGVGMDIVRANIERLNGSIEVYSRVGEGTTFELTLPLTLAIVPSMLVNVGGGVYAIPLSAVVDVQSLEGKDTSTIEGRQVVVLRGHVLPIIRLADLFDGHCRSDVSEGRMVVVRWGRLEAGFVVDGLIGNQDVVIKSLGPLLGEIQGFAGGSILGNGTIALILDVPSLFRLALRLQKDVAADLVVDGV